MSDTVLRDIATIQINDEFYQLVRRGEDGTLRREFVDEPPWVDGTPNMLSEPSDTWHLGGLKSRPGFPGTSEYGKNSDCRWPGRILPGPKLYGITLTDSAANPTGFFEAFDQLFVRAGDKVYRIDPSDDSVIESEEFASTVQDGVRSDGIAVISLANQLWKLEALASPDVWDSGTVGAPFRKLAVGLDRLFAINRYSVLKNVISGGDPVESTDYSDVVQCGDSDTDYPANSLVAYGKTVLVGKPEGVFGVDAEGKGVPVIKRIARNVNNFKGMTSVDPWVFCPHSRGTSRWMPGYVESCGIETELLNESIIRGKFTAFAVDGKWIYGVLPVGSDVCIMVARDRAEDEAGFGPYIWDTLIYMSSVTCEALWVSSLWDPPRLFFGNDYNVGYVKLSAGGGAPDPVGSDYRFNANASRYTHRYNFGDEEPKDFVKAALTCKGITDNEYWELYYSVDGGAYSKVDIDSNNMKVTEDGRTVFYLPQSAKGREIQYYFSYAGNSDTAPAEIVHFEPFAMPQSRKVPQIPVTLRLAEGLRHSAGKEARDANIQLNDLITLSESATAIDLKGPWGDFSGWVRRVRVIDAVQEGNAPHELIAEALLQRREES